MSAAGPCPEDERTLQLNLEVLKRSRGGVFDLPESDPPARFEGGSPPGAAVQTADGRWLRLHSVRAPLEEADRLVGEAFTSGEPPLVIVIGLGLGYVLDAVERRSATTKVLALEPLPGTLRLFLQRREWASWMQTDRLTLLVGPQYTGAMDGWKVVDPTQPVPCIESPVVLREFAPAARQARQLADRIVAGALSNAEARRRFAAPYLLNTLENLPVLVHEADVASLFGLFPRVPAVLVAAGPSLDRNIDELTHVADTVCLIAVDTALRPLLAAGIVPQLVVGLEASELNGRHLTHLANVEGVWLVGEGSLDPPVFDAFAGRVFNLRVSNHEPWPWLKEQGLDRGTLGVWGSVLTGAFDLACRMGCDPIVFAGADLAYTSDLTYCRNTIYEADWAHLQTDEARRSSILAYLDQSATFQATDVHGNQVRTATRFIQFRDWLVARASERPGNRVVNATGEGILHGGPIEQAPLGSLILPEIDPRELRSRIDAAWQHRKSDRTRAAENLAALSRLDDGDAIPIDRWVDFAAGRATAKDITVTVRCSLRRVASAHLSHGVRAAFCHPRDQSARWCGEGVTITPARDALGDTWIPVVQVREDSSHGFHRATVVDLILAGPQSHTLRIRPVNRDSLYLQSIDGDLFVIFDFRSVTWIRAAGTGDVSVVLRRMSDGWFLCGVSSTTPTRLTDVRVGVCDPGTDVYALFQGDPNAGFDMAELVSTPGLELHHSRLQDGCSERAP